MPLPPALRKALSKTLSEDDLARLDDLRDHAARQAPEIAQQFFNFTSHGVDHFDEVARLAQALSDPIELPEAELFCLIAACYLHDLGMSHTSAQHVFELREQEQLRRWHARLSLAHINTLDAEDFGGEGFRSVVGRVSEGHGRWDWEHADFNDLYGLRIRLLVALLSLADVLDLRSDRRIPRKDVTDATQLMNIEALKTDLSRVHWLKHYYAQQASVQKAEGRTVEITLQARIGMRKPDVAKPELDDREPLIKQLIQSEVVDLLEHEPFGKILASHLDVRLKRAPGAWRSYVHSQPDTSKMLFPEALISTALEAGMVGRRELKLDSTTYYDARIEPFVAPNDILVSVAWVPTFATKDNVPEGPYRVIHEMLARLGEQTWDYVLWPTAPYVSGVVADLTSDAEGEARKRIERSLGVTEAIRNGSSRKYYIATDAASEPLASTRHIAKFAQYRGFPSRDNFKGGAIHIRTEKQRNDFENTCATVADKLRLHNVPQKDLPALLAALASTDTAYDVTVTSILQVWQALIERLGSWPAYSAFRDFVIERKAFLERQSGQAQARAKALLDRRVELVSAGPDAVNALMAVEEASSEFPWANRESFLKHVDSGTAWSVRLVDRCVGYVLTSVQDSGELRLVKMAIHPGYRRRGFAGRILDHVQTLAQAGQHPAVELHVRTSNAAAIALYKRHAYATVELLENYYENTGTTPRDKNAWRMRRSFVTTRR